MKIENLKSIIIFSLNSVTSHFNRVLGCVGALHDQATIISEILTTIDNIEDKYSDGVVRLVGENTLINMLNETTYNDYGAAYRENNNQEPTFEAYKAAVNSRHDFSDLEDDVLKIAFEIISDLFQMNEQEDYNDSDGAFRRSSVEKVKR